MTAVIGKADVYDNVHAGDVVLGGDGEAWGVKQIDHTPQGALVTLIRHGRMVPGFPPPGTPVTVLHRSGVDMEAAAFFTLQAEFGDVSLVLERWDES